MSVLQVDLNLTEVVNILPRYPCKSKILTKKKKKTVNIY